jgi:hypothetical protein
VGQASLFDNGPDFSRPPGPSLSILLRIGCPGHIDASKNSDELFEIVNESAEIISEGTARRKLQILTNDVPYE